MKVNGHGEGRAPAFPPTRFRDARLVTVIRVVAVEGAGTTANPMREVVQYLATTGELLAVSDPLPRVR